MKRSTAFIAAVLAATLAVVPMAGCGSQGTSDSESDSASAATEQTQEDTITELKDVVANAPEFKSVTVHEEAKSIVLPIDEDGESEESGESDTIETTADYKFDASGDSLKTSVTYKVGNIELTYISDGDDAVCITDGPTYSGTTEQLDDPVFEGFDAYLEEKLGDIDTIIDCADAVTKEQEGDATTYTLTLDPNKYMASDEILTLMAENDPVTEATFELSFDKDGYLIGFVNNTQFKYSDSEVISALSDFDSTVVDPLPEADKTYDEMDEDIQKKYDELLEDSETDASSDTDAETEGEAK